MSAADFIALNKLRGLTPRQRRLLELEAVYYGTQYHGLPPWEQEIGKAEDGTVKALCGHEREPTLKAGIIEEKVETLVDMLVGEGRFPAVEIDDEDLDEQIKAVKLHKRIRGPARDLIVKGSGALEIGTPDGVRLEVKHLRPEWCEPIFVAKAGRPRAAQIASELAALLEPLGFALPAPRAGDHLWTPEGAPSDELCWLRYEYVFHDEEATRDGASSDVAWRHRVDYGPTLTVYYHDVMVYGDATTAPAWRVSDVVIHDWGMVPVAWSRTPDAEDGEPDGPSFVTEALRSIAEAADRMLTRKDASVSVVANPKAYTVDLEDLVANVNADMGMPSGWRASSGEVLTFQSTGNGQAKIGLLEPTGKGPETAKAHYDDLAREAARVSRVIAHDPQQAAGAQSGTALQRMMEPTVQRVGAYRVAVGELLETVVAKGGVVIGRGPVAASVQWGPVIAPTASDLQALAQAYTLASGGPVMSRATAVKLFATAAEVEDPDAEVQAVTRDAEDALRDAREAMQREILPGGGGQETETAMASSESEGKPPAVP